MAEVKVEMPQMGESVMEGEIIEWTKNVGDKVSVDETILEVATDKVDSEIPSPESGVLVEQLAAEGDTVEVGEAIAVIETDPDAAGGSDDESASEEDEEGEESDSASEEDQEDGGSEDAQQVDDKSEEDDQEQEESEEQEESSQDEDEGERVEVTMPQMGESVMEGEVIEWVKKVGDQVEEDETLLEVSTDKVDSEIPSPQSGTLKEIIAEEGETVEVGQPIAIIATGKAAQQTEQQEDGSESEEKVSEQEKASSNDQANDSEGTQELQRIGSNGRFYSPLVRSIAKEEGISQSELEDIEGSGQGGRVSKDDVIQYLDGRESEQKEQASEESSPAKQEKDQDGLSKPSSAHQAPAQGEQRSISAGELDIQRPSKNVETIKMDRMRKMIAEHMVRSKQISAHVSTFNEVDVTPLVQWREEHKEEFHERTGAKLTFTPLFIEKIIQAIGEFPLLNSSVDTDNDQILLKRDINFGLAVALGEGGKGGLIVPVIKQAQDKNLVGLAKSVHELAVNARNKDLDPDDLVGGTITLTNYGSVGNLMGTPIINQPQVAILGTGAIKKRPVVKETPEGDVIAIRHMMFLTMSYDHRIIDGAHGGAFLNRVKDLLENFDTDRTY